MIRTLTLLATSITLAACQPVPGPGADTQATPVTEPKQGPPEAVQALATTYSFHVAEAPHEDCLIQLDDLDVGEAGAAHYRAWISARCYEAFPILQELSNWSPQGETGVDLKGGDDGGVLVSLHETTGPEGGWRKFSGVASDGRTYEVTATQ